MAGVVRRQTRFAIFSPESGHVGLCGHVRVPIRNVRRPVRMGPHEQTAEASAVSM